jgi:SAM-dependent methyltransferase
MAKDEPVLLTDRDYLQTRQYRTDANLAARQSIYQYQRPMVDLPAAVLDLAELAGSETIADIGCGNGIYLAELMRRGHAGKVIGADLSAGMLHAARRAAAGAGLTAGDAAALPFADGVTDITLAPHMLYHVPDRLAAVRELRRITIPGGRVIVVLNGPDHLIELTELASAAAVDFGAAWPASRAENRADGGLDLAAGAKLLAGVFAEVQRHDFVSELAVPGPEPILDYIRSMRLTQSLDDPEGMVSGAARRLTATSDGVIRITTRTGCLICR